MVTLITELFERFPYVGIAVGVLMLVVGGAVGAIMLNDYLNTPDNPQPLTIDTVGQISERTWVDLSGGTWDCQTLDQMQVGSNWQTEAVLRDGTRSTVVLVTFSGQKACTQLPSGSITGDLYRMSDRMKSANQSQLAGYPDSAAYWALCEYCGRDNTLIGVIVLFALAFGGLVITGISVDKL